MGEVLRGPILKAARMMRVPYLKEQEQWKKLQVRFAVYSIWIERSQARALLILGGA